MNKNQRAGTGWGAASLLAAVGAILGAMAEPALAQAASAAGQAASGSMMQGAEGAVGNVFQFFEPVAESGMKGVFTFLNAQQFVFLLVAMAIGYPLGKVKVGPISLGSTAGTLLVAVLISMTAQSAFGMTYSIPGIVSTIFLALFMYALGLGVGPKFFAGLKSAGIAAMVIGVVVWALNWVICFFGAKLAGLEPGYAAGLISGSYTITAVLGVAQTAVQSGTEALPEGLSPEKVGANMAAGYAISYILSSVGIILLIRYLPQMFGHDPVADAKAAEEAYSGGAQHALPGTPHAFMLGYTPIDIRAYELENDALVGRSVSDLYKEHPHAPILRVVRGDTVIEPEENPTLQKGDIIAVRADVGEMILKGGTVGPEVAEPRARDVPIEVADVHVGSHEVSGKTLEELAASVGFGVRLSAMFRAAQEIPFGPSTDVRFGDVLRLSGPAASIQRAAAALGGKPHVESTATEVMYLAIAMTIGYVVGVLSITVAGIPFALGTSAGCLLMGIFVSYFRSRNPDFGGPVSEGARSFLQDIGLNMFVAVLGANVGPKIISALSGDTVIWLAGIGLTAALLPVVVAFLVGQVVFKLNSVINDGACAGARNSTPGLNAILDQSKSAIAAVPYPVSYALTTVLALIGGYIAQILS